MGRRKQAKFKVGDKIEIFSNTNKQWCKGEVIGVEGSEDGAMANCSYISTTGVEMSKKIAMGHQNLRFDDSFWPTGMEPAQAGLAPSERQTQVLTEAEKQSPGQPREKARSDLSKASEDGRLAESLIENRPQDTTETS